MIYRGAIFDMGDIFYDATPWRRALAAQLAEAGVDIDYTRLVPLWERALLPVYIGKQPYWDAFRAFIGTWHLEKSELIRIEAAAKSRAQETEMRELFDGVAATLNQLNDSGIRMAVLSDTESAESRVRERLAKFGIEHCFAAVLTSFDIRYVKPQMEAFQLALDKIGITKDQSVFVGHDVDELEGAMDFGITAVGYNYQPAAPADFYLNHFSELYHLMHYGCLKPASLVAPKANS